MLKPPVYLSMDEQNSVSSLHVDRVGKPIAIESQDAEDIVHIYSLSPQGL
jgi:hypothetical protein